MNIPLRGGNRLPWSQYIDVMFRGAAIGGRRRVGSRTASSDRTSAICSRSICNLAEHSCLHVLFGKALKYGELRLQPRWAVNLSRSYSRRTGLFLWRHLLGYTGGYSAHGQCASGRYFAKLFDLTSVGLI
jgi:outer membrane receptor protein involved in Fe transport